MGGKINLVCFDKTGTLTEEGLDILGVRTVDRSDGNFSELYEEIDNVPVVGAEDLKTPLVHALATCHGLKAVNGQIIGDPLDLRMFQFTGWSMEEAGDSLGPSNTPDESQTLLPSQPHSKYRSLFFLY
jgi:cation-transporting ATPase 13A3/4/5